MKWRWYVAAALVGAFAGAGLLVFTSGPKWRSGPNAGRLIDFSADGREFVTTLMPAPVSNNYPAPIVMRWDVNSGRLISRVEFSCDEDHLIKEIRVSTDGQRALVGEGSAISPSRANFEHGQWFIHDAVTGRRMTGPVKGLAQVPHNSFALNGQWFFGYRGQVRANAFVINGITIYSAAMGERILDLADQDGKRAVTCLFAPDGTTAAIHWRKTEDSLIQQSVSVIELPSGRERHRIDLPERTWIRVDRWDGRTLEAVESVPGHEPDQTVWQTCVFDLTRNPVGNGYTPPLLNAVVGGTAGTNYWEAGDDWVAYFRIVPLAERSLRQEQWQAWLAGKVGFDRAPLGVAVTVRAVDRKNGMARSEIPRVIGHPCFVSTDGRHLACRGVGDSLEVWDLNPGPRWPLPLGVGALSAGIVLAFARRLTLRGRRWLESQLPANSGYPPLP